MIVIRRDVFFALGNVKCSVIDQLGISIPGLLLSLTLHGVTIFPPSNVGLVHGAVTGDFHQGGEIQDRLHQDEVMRGSHLLEAMTENGRGASTRESHLREGAMKEEFR